MPVCDCLCDCLGRATHAPPCWQPKTAQEKPGQRGQSHTCCHSHTHAPTSLSKFGTSRFSNCKSKYLHQCIFNKEFRKNSVFSFCDCSQSSGPQNPGLSIFLAHCAWRVERFLVKRYKDHLQAFDEFAGGGGEGCPLGCQAKSSSHFGFFGTVGSLGAIPRKHSARSILLIERNQIVSLHWTQGGLFAFVVEEDGGGLPPQV